MSHIRRARYLVGLGAIALLACDPTVFTGAGAATNGQVSWRVRDQQVEITNASGQTIRYALLGRTYMHSTTSQFCFGASTCGLAIAANLTVLVAYIDIIGSARPETEAMLVWWVPDGTTVVPFDTAVVQIR